MRMTCKLIKILSQLLLGTALFILNLAFANYNKIIDWSFDGIFGYLDKTAAQRGFQIYKDVCSSCHSLKYISYIDLKGLDFTDDEIKTLASQYKVMDQFDNEGNLSSRTALSNDKFVGPYRNEIQARLANNDLYPPDLSLIVKARLDGPNYIYSLLTGYYEKPQNFSIEDGLYFNLYFPNYKIGMPPPLIDNMLQYQDGTESSMEQMAKDVVIFLQWCAEPEMESRKTLGMKVIIFLSIFGTIVYIRKRQIWSRIKK